VMDADAIDFDEGSFDAVVGRQVLMFLDLDVALRHIHRVLRPGGRFAAVVWAALADNPFHAALLETSRAHGGWGDDPPEMARAFERGDPEAYRRALERAAFREPSVVGVASERRFASAAEALSMVRESPLMSAPIAALPASLHDAAWAQVEARFRRCERDGSCTFAMACFVVSGAR
jgi:SAM-dependent methyltransferase